MFFMEGDRDSDFYRFTIHNDCIITDFACVFIKHFFTVNTIL